MLRPSCSTATLEYSSTQSCINLAKGSNHGYEAFGLWLIPQYLQKVLLLKGVEIIVAPHMSTILRHTVLSCAVWPNPTCGHARVRPSYYEIEFDAFSQLKLLNFVVDFAAPQPCSEFIIQHSIQTVQRQWA